MFFVFFEGDSKIYRHQPQRWKGTVGCHGGGNLFGKNIATIAIGADLSASIGGRTNQTARATTTQLLCRSDLYQQIYLICKIEWLSCEGNLSGAPVRRSETRCDHTQWYARLWQYVPRGEQWPYLCPRGPNLALRCCSRCRPTPRGCPPLHTVQPTPLRGGCSQSRALHRGAVSVLWAGMLQWCVS